VTGLHDLLARSAAAGLRLQRPDGSLPGGTNGPYGDPETPVRNTAHWLVLFATTYFRTGEAGLREAALRAARYLASPEARPAGASFLCRTRAGKDACNGLVGQAWAIEALAEAALSLDAEPFAKLAEAVFLRHPFDARTGLWSRVEVDGRLLGPDFTLNHQLWFAAAGALLAPLAAAEVDLRVRAFLAALPRSLALHRDGAVRHAVSPAAAARALPGAALRLARERLRGRAALREKALGYHAFNLHALAILCARVPDHGFFSSARFERAWRFAGSQAFTAALAGNRYAWPYNPTGLEMAWALEVFSPGSRAEQERWVAEQLRRHFDPTTGLLARATPDPATLAARLYEAARLGDLAIPDDALEARAA
jgi:hypothetical protein